MFLLCSHVEMLEDLPFTIIRNSDGEVLARVATLLLAREVFRLVANVNFPEEVLLKQETRSLRPAQGPNESWRDSSAGNRGMQ